MIFFHPLLLFRIFDVISDFSFSFFFSSWSCDQGWSLSKVGGRCRTWACPVFRHCLHTIPIIRPVRLVHLYCLSLLYGHCTILSYPPSTSAVLSFTVCSHRTPHSHAFLIRILSMHPLYITLDIHHHLATPLYTPLCSY